MSITADNDNSIVHHEGSYTRVLSSPLGLIVMLNGLLWASILGVGWLVLG